MSMKNSLKNLMKEFKSLNDSKDSMNDLVES